MSTSSSPSINQETRPVSILVEGANNGPVAAAVQNISAPEEGRNEAGSPQEEMVSPISEMNLGPAAIVDEEFDVNEAGPSGGVPPSSAGATLRPNDGKQPESSVSLKGEAAEEQDEDVNQEDDAEDDESDYSYEYCDDEDEGQYSGFLGSNEPEPVAVGIARSVSRLSEPARSLSDLVEINPDSSEKKKKWREPTRAAVNMSLRAEKEKTGGRRRLAQDLYKIMTADTKEAGFSLEPVDEDSMDKWCISLFGFDDDSCLAKDLLVCGTDSVELEMSFPNDYPFAPPFVRVTKPRFQRQSGFVMSGALCMELLTADGWNPVNDIESVIVSIRSLMVVGNGRLQAAVDMGREKYEKALANALALKKEGKIPAKKDEEEEEEEEDSSRKRDSNGKPKASAKKSSGGSYSTEEAKNAYKYLSDYHQKEGWDKNGYWSRRG